MEVEILKVVGRELLRYWWIISPVVLFFILEELWLVYRQAKYLSELNWVLLEIRIPRQIKRITKAMEHLFSAFHNMYLPPDWKEKWVEGRVQEWVSLEIVGQGGGSVHFYIYTPSKFRNLIEAQIYAQYPGAEISEADDYTKSVSDNVPSEQYESWGAEIKLVKDEPYPIRTYIEFESDKEEQSSDPLGPLLETLSNLKEREQIWIQYLIKPSGGNERKEAAEKLIAKLAKRETKAPKKLAVDYLGDLLGSFGDTAAISATEKKEEKRAELTPGERDVIKAVEANAAKLSYETVIRFIYLAPPAVFNRAQIPAVFASFKQFNTLNMNGFKPNKETLPIASWPRKAEKILFKKRILFRYYKLRSFRVFLLWAQKGSFLSTEELATIYHFPTILTSAPAVIRVEAKKREPPPTLPTL